MKPNPYQIAPITDKALLRAHFNQDRPLYAYALGDLDDAMWQISTYLGAYQAGHLESVALIWRGVNPPALVQFGPPEAAEALFPHLPDKVFYMLPDSLLPTYQRHFETSHLTALWRMHVTPDTFQPAAVISDNLRRLTGADLPMLQQLYEDDGPRAELIEALSASQIDAGLFFGIIQDGRLVAVAGSHFCSRHEQIGAVGYVYTARQVRGQGYATLTTSAVTQAFFDMGIITVVLNVTRLNAPAIHVYEKLGYRIHAAIAEGYGLRLPGHSNQLSLSSSVDDRLA